MVPLREMSARIRLVYSANVTFGQTLEIWFGTAPLSSWAWMAAIVVVFYTFNTRFPTSLAFQPSRRLPLHCSSSLPSPSSPLFP